MNNDGLVITGQGEKGTIIRVRVGSHDMGNVYVGKGQNFSVELRGAGESVEEIRSNPTAPKLKKLDWSKMPKGTLVTTFINNELIDVYLFRYNAEANDFCVYRNGIAAKGRASPITNTARVILAENPEFTFWQGGECPFPPGVKVEVVSRDGETACDEATAFNWAHDISRSISAQIIAYRVLGLCDGWEN